RLGLGGEIVDKTLEDQALVGRGGAQLEVGAGDEAEVAREVAAVLVAAGLANEVIGREGRNAESLPKGLPDGALVADVLLKDHEHLAEGAGQHVEVTDGRVLACVAG